MDLWAPLRNSFAGRVAPTQVARRFAKVRWWKTATLGSFMGGPLPAAGRLTPQPLSALIIQTPVRCP